MKKKAIVIVSLGTIMVGLILAKGLSNVSAFDTAKDDTKQLVKKENSPQASASSRSENKTIKALVQSLKDKDQDYSNSYLDYPDYQVVIAAPDGSFVTSTDPNYLGEVGVITNPDGSQLILDTRSEDAASIGEIKEALRQVKTK
ncbi:hypothetical protein N1495_01570 [Streptococcus didelphis]|uniref:Signal peptide containing protein n=1 Tax=Streptococcus didelphis TaxID=102886 RepID=A0ABY9LFW2_9STRE|nr:hypothetical protein [Streptococcus didelphis]WMB27807.1 hypothetical protein N1496_07030 [Streptococcus didelphis]WMB29729.1 hypothetical protein N1495_01570 [Streptococcus didelphis]